MYDWICEKGVTRVLFCNFEEAIGQTQAELYILKVEKLDARIRLLKLFLSNMLFLYVT